MQNFSGGSATAPVSQVELTLSCRNLADMDVFSKSDPFIVVYVAHQGMKSWTEFKRTEVIYDNLNPDFATKINMAFHFEEQQRLRFEVYDIDAPSEDLSKHDFLGYRECTLGELVSSRTSQLPLLNVPRAGVNSSLLVRAEELLRSKFDAALRLSARRLDSKGWFSSSPSPYLELFKSNEDGEWSLTWRTEVVRGTRDPVWQPIDVPVGALCNGDHERNIRAVCWHWRRSGTPSLLGECQFSIRQLERGSATGARVHKLDLINAEKQRKKGASYTNSGELYIGLELRPHYSFLDYIQGGTDLACTIAIDFTASNGAPTSAESLHTLCVRDPSGNIYNPYVTALRAVGEIIQDYDSDKQFPVLGFGARLPPDGVVSHEFFVNLSPVSPYCHGVQGVVEAYQQCLPRIQLYGPTNFAPVIHHVANFARQSRNGSQYCILLIITDGVITDMPQTKQAIVEASGLPLSIIIVGVGTADFSAMEELDGDEVRVSYCGRAAERDIVQFVPFAELQRGDPATLRARLAREVLAEVPSQFISYMKANRIAAAPPKEGVTELPPDPSLV
ncbi:copine-8-like [Amphibalanus amphitrite]|uniref:copine-8-like n=1 Tax=Amphibalanus amphitrite TaxID=1232801 RepID=UPI001C8FD797|nr:copine-8-like [Amphibalanus amphitrite]XP_043246540.1 copine-8-like [Amphibalanus amphitrite]